MARSGLFEKTSVSPAHLPTIMLMIGYPVFWLELYWFDVPGHATPLAGVLFVLFSVWVLIRQRAGAVALLKEAKQTWQAQPGIARFFLAVGSFAALVTLGVAFYASLLPPHLVQEFDVLNYHLTLPRQHLILGSFKHIPWSTADLYFLPLDFALAPYWLVTELPNKFPQFLFFLGFVGIVARLVRRFNLNKAAGMVVIIPAIFGSHNVGIQLGTGMLDIVMAYLLLAALDSFLEGAWALAAVEFVFYFWSKSFIPVQSILIVVVLCVLFVLLRKSGWRNVSWVPGSPLSKKDLDKYKKSLLKVAFGFAALSLAVGGPFVIKSLYYAGTPLFPFYPGLVKMQPDINSDSVRWQSIVERAEQVRATKDQYGSGRSPMDFIQHLWLIAVPEEGVNNRYDYPVGLMYLLFLGPFLYFSAGAVRQKEFSILPFFVIVFWASWWMGSHQSRFLFIPIILMFIVVAARIGMPSKTLTVAMTIALLLVGLSVARAHKNDIGAWAYDVLREKDKELVAMSKTVRPDEMVRLDFFDAAFAEFPVEVSGSDSVFVLEYGEKE